MKTESSQSSSWRLPSDGRTGAQLCACAATGATVSASTAAMTTDQCPIRKLLIASPTYPPFEVSPRSERMQAAHRQNATNPTGTALWSGSPFARRDPGRPVERDRASLLPEYTAARSFTARRYTCRMQFTPLSLADERGIDNLSFGRVTSFFRTVPQRRTMRGRHGDTCGEGCGKIVRGSGESGPSRLASRSHAATWMTECRPSIERGLPNGGAGRMGGCFRGGGGGGG